MGGNVWKNTGMKSIKRMKRRTIALPLSCDLFLFSLLLFYLFSLSRLLFSKAHDKTQPLIKTGRKNMRRSTITYIHNPLALHYLCLSLPISFSLSPFSPHLPLLPISLSVLCNFSILSCTLFRQCRVPL